MQQVLGALDPALRHVDRRRDPVRGPEEPEEVVAAQPRDRGHRVEVDRLGVVPVGVVAGLAGVEVMLLLRFNSSLFRLSWVREA